MQSLAIDLPSPALIRLYFKPYTTLTATLGEMQSGLPEKIARLKVKKIEKPLLRL